MIGGLLQTIFGPSAFQSTADGVKGVLTADGYNAFGAMHGTIMVFFGIVPIAFAAFGKRLAKGGKGAHFTVGDGGIKGLH